MTEFGFEKYHKSLIDSQLSSIERLLKVSANELAKEISILKVKRSLKPSKYGAQLMQKVAKSKKIKSILEQLNSNLLLDINNKTLSHWELSNMKNDKLVFDYIGSNPTRYSNVNLEALEAFQKRSVGGYTLSDRIHNVVEMNKSYINDYLGSGITNGKSSAQIARDLNAINSNPYNVTVYDKNGDPTTLSKINNILKQGASGRGIYRSPLKNLFRVARTETNAAYRIADNTRWQQLDFVVGYEVKLSAAHPKDDMCDWLKGRYPKSFVFEGWHPSCFCYVTSILKTKEEFKNDVDKSKNEVKRIPRSAQRYVKTKDMTNYNWYNENFTKKNTPKAKVGGSSSNIEAYKNKVY